MCGAPICESGWGFRILCWTRWTSAVSIGAHMEVAEKRHKRGDVREDGLLFWAYYGGSKRREQWVTPEKFAANNDRQRRLTAAAAERSTDRYERIRRGTPRADGLVYHKWDSNLKKHRWVTSERLAELTAKTKARKVPLFAPGDSSVKRGFVREDGLVFWARSPNRPGGAWWVTPEKFSELAEREKARRVSSPNRGLVVGQVRDSDGRVFFGYKQTYPNGECWLDPHVFAVRLAARKARDRGRPKKGSSDMWRRAHERNKGNPLAMVRLKLRTRLKGASHRAAKSGNLYPRGVDALTVKWLLWLANRLGIDPRDGRKNHIEHLRPARCFDLTAEEGQRAFNAPENTWWLTAADNLSKNDRDPTPEEVELHGLYLAEYRQTK